jgi:hypothetical protein
MLMTNRIFLFLLFGLLACSLEGCSIVMSQTGISSVGELYSATRKEAREKFGTPDEIKTCPDGLTVECFWIRVKLSSEWIRTLGFNVQSLGLLEIVLFPMAIYASEKEKLHYAFVWAPREGCHVQDK